MKKNKTIGFVVLWQNEVTSTENEGGCDAEFQHLNRVDLRTLKECKEFIEKHLSAFSDVSIGKVVSI